MKKNFIIYLYISIILISCNGVDEIMIKGQAKKINFSDIAEDQTDTSLLKSVTYIPLESKSNCLIGEVNRILFKIDKFYIFDQQNKTVFVFNRNGDFLFKINRIGKGPGEYIEPMDFDVDSSGNIYIYDNGFKKLIKYSSDGQQFEEFKFKYRFEEFKVAEQSKIFVHNVFDNGKEVGISSKLGVCDLKNGKLQTLIPGRKLEDDDRITRPGFKFLFKSDNDISYFNPIFSNKIFKITKNDVTEAIEFDKDLFPPAEFISKIRQDYSFAFTTDRYITAITDIYETNDFTIMKFNKGYYFPHIILSKESGKKISKNRFIDRNYFGDNSIYGTSDNKFISFFQTEDYLKDNWKDQIRKSTLSNDVKSKLLSLTAESNPVIILIEFKKF